MSSRGRSGLRVVVAVVTVALTAVLMLEVSPHLVHHLFDHDVAHEDCPFAALAERTPTASGHGVIVALVDDRGAPAVATAPPRKSSRDRSARSARAPPLAS